MNNSEVRTALTGQGLTVLGFDACLMGMIESIYEFKGLANYMIASPETIPSAGWDYDAWLTSFLATGLSVTNLYTTVIDTYAANYSGTPTTCLAAYDLSQANNLYTAYNNFATDLYNYLLNASHVDRFDTIFGTILNNTEQYITPANGGNFHLDVYDLAYNFASLTNSSALRTAVDNTVVYNWTQPSGDIYTGNPNSHGIASYFGTLIDDGEGGLALSYDINYINNNVTLFTTSSIWPDFIKALQTFPVLTGAVWASATTYNDASIVLNAVENYFIYISGAGTVSATLNNYGSNDLDLYLYDFASNITGSDLSFSESGDPTETVSYTFSNTHAHKGWYIIQVHHYSGSTTPYRLVISGSNLK